MVNREILQAFETHQRARGLSRSTIERRRYSLRKLAVFAAPVPLLEVAPTMIEEWLGGYKSAETKHAYLADVRALFHYACRRGMAVENPTEELGSVRRPHALPHPISEGDLALAIVTAEDPRLKLVLLFGSLAGLRRAEIANLRAEDCTEERMVVRGKGARDRVIPMHPYLWSEMQAYGMQHGWLFEARHGGPVLPQTVGMWVTDHFKKMTINSSLHATRHRFGTKIAQNTHGNMLAVRDLLGHSRLTTTEGYVKFDTSGLGQIVNDLQSPERPKGPE